MTVNAADLALLGQLYSPGSLDDPSYVITGGSAVLCWLHDAPYRRKHADIDLLVVKPETFEALRDNHTSPFLVGTLTQSGISAAPGVPTVELQTVPGSYYDAEIIPGLRDLRSVTIRQTPLLVLSPEFLLVSKLTYPNVHRSVDFSDAFALYQYGCVRDSDYLGTLLMRTSLGQLLDITDFLQTNSARDFEALAGSVYYKLVKQFVYWKHINIEVLNPYQCFVLLDVRDRLLQLSSEALELIANAFDAIIPTPRTRQAAMLGYCFVALELPIKTLEEMLWSPTCREIVFHYLPGNVSLYISNFKRLQMILKTCNQLEKLTNSQCESLRQFGAMDKIVKRVLLAYRSSFTLWALVRALYEKVITGRISGLECMDKLLSHWIA